MGVSEKVRREKNLYKGSFQYRDSVVFMYAKAYTERQAWLVMCRRIARKHNLRFDFVMSHFREGNYTITKEESA